MTNGGPVVPVVEGWKKPYGTIERVVNYLGKKDPELRLAIIDYFIGELFLARSNEEARRVPPRNRRKEEASAKRS